MYFGNQSIRTLDGSDAIGGSIHLQNAPRWQHGLQAGIQQNIGSFGQYFTAGNVNWGNGKLESRTQAYRYSTDNDFTVRISPTENTQQQNASVFNYGIQQAINYRIASNQYVSLQGWHHFSDKQTQSTRGDRFSNDLLRERSTRVVADYVLNNSIGFFNVKLGYINDYLLFNQNSTTATQRGIAALKYEKQLHKNLSLQLGTQWIHIRTNVDAYDGEITEDRTSVYGSLRWQIIPRWQMSLNVRQAFVTDFLAPFAPSLGTEFILYQNKSNKLLIKALASKNYRIPTLNDRFWQGTGGVGNPNLRAETGWSAEGGLAYENKTQNTSWKAEATYYQMKITDWILWKPIGNVWSPVNVAQVNGSGIEANLQIKIKQSRGYISLGANYAYTLSTIMQDDNPDFIGKQLLYVPFHSSNAFAFWQFDRWFLQADVNQTGFRYLENSNANFVQGFALANLGVGKNFKLKHHWWSISVRINNLLDHDYESVNNRAMPGRNYQLSLRYQIKSF